MNYYIMKHSSKTSIIGRIYPQLERMYEGFHYDRPYEDFGLKNGIWESPSSKVAIFNLRQSAKMTDLVSGGAFTSELALFSDRFFTLLRQFDCMDMIPLNAEVLHKENKHAYKFVHMPLFYVEFVDFEKSRFYIGYGQRWVADVGFASFEDYQEKKKALDAYNNTVDTGQRYIKLLELRLDESKVTLDFFRLNYFASSWIVSKRLKEAIEAAGMTGMEFLPAQGHTYPTMDYTVDPPRPIT